MANLYLMPFSITYKSRCGCLYLSLKISTGNTQYIKLQQYKLKRNFIPHQFDYICATMFYFVKIELYLKQIISFSEVASILSGNEGLTSLSHPLLPSTLSSVPIILNNSLQNVFQIIWIALPELCFRNCIRKFWNNKLELDFCLRIFFITDNMSY